jgi:hypothetical protein
MKSWKKNPTNVIKNNDITSLKNKLNKLIISLQTLSLPRFAGRRVARLIKTYVITLS